jgi:nucleoside-diphosphate-sugar epimerase
LIGVDGKEAESHMNILLIGASGLIGAAIAARLIAAGHRVVGVARHPSGDRDGMTWRTARGLPLATCGKTPAIVQEHRLRSRAG